jgi:hypothetical protein
MLLFFMRVTCAFDFGHLAYLFAVSIKTVKRAFRMVLFMLDEMLDDPDFDLMTEKALSDAPAMECLKQEFGRVLLILDGTEFFIQTPRRSATQKLTWSTYKHHHTTKVLVGINRAGQVAYVSDCYPGRISDKQLITKTKVLFKIPPGAAVMVDKGFLILDLAKDRGITVVIPPMASSKEQMSAEHLVHGRSISAARIHVERAIERAKSFRILANELHNSSFKYVSTLVRVCFKLTNFRGELVLDMDAEQQ